MEKVINPGADGFTLTRWLNSLRDQSMRKNWRVLKEPDEFLPFRFWLVTFPEGALVTFRVVYERQNFPGVVDISGNEELSPELLELWYLAQRVPGDG